MYNIYIYIYTFIVSEVLGLKPKPLLPALLESLEVEWFALDAADSEQEDEDET